jgi:hypothetical protein
MTTGVLLFAFNNEQMDYVRLANYCAQKVKRAWNLPVCLVTSLDAKVGAHVDEVVRLQDIPTNNRRVYADYGATLSFRNTNRSRALALTPFDRTIVNDTDFLPNTDVLPKLWGGDTPLMVSRRAHNVLGLPLPADVARLNYAGAPMYWATIVMFDKHSPVTHRFFAHWQKAVDNVRYFARLFQYSESPMRNDFAVSAAMRMLHEGVALTTYDLPYSIPTAFASTLVRSLEPLVLGEVGRHSGDIHIMNKRTLLETICGLEAF